MKNEIDPKLACELLEYEPGTGLLYWKERPVELFTEPRFARAWNTRYAGKQAITSDNGLGYKIGSIFGRHFLAHRLAWAISYGEWPDIIDHINGNPGDNRIANLRSVTATENSCNTRLYKKNTSGHVGVTWSSTANKWAAQISINRKAIFLGVFDDKNAAIAARKRAEAELGFHPNHGRTAA